MANCSRIYFLLLACLLVTLSIQLSNVHDRHLPTRSPTGSSKEYVEERNHGCDQSFTLKTASCRNRGLNSVPQNLSQDIEVLDLGHNNITRLLNVSFELYPLINNLDISSNNIRVIESAAFYPLKDLTSLYLDYNPDLVLPETGVFMMSHRLSILDLVGSKLKSLPNDILKYSQHLGLVEMSFTQISTVNLTYCGMANTVAMTGNKIHNLTLSEFIFACQTSSLDLKGNPIQTVDPDVISSLHVRSLELGDYPLSDDVVTNCILGVSKSSIKQLKILRGSLGAFPVGIFDPLLDYPLYVLDLGKNYLTGLHPMVFSNLTQVLELRIYENALSIPEIRPDFFTGMKALTVLVLLENQIRQINPDNQTWSLKLSELYLMGNLISEISAYTFRGLRNLTTLDMSSNKYLSVFELTDESGLDSIHTVSLSGSRISVLALKTPSLKSLSMNYIRSDFLPLRPGESFQHLQSLSKLNMADSAISLFNIWDATTNTSLFDGLLNLNYLILSNNPFLSIVDIPPWVFRRLSALKELFLVNCFIKTLHPLVFSGLGSLQKLDLYGNNIQHLNGGVLYMLEQVESIDLNGNQISYIEEVTFSNNGKLHSLSLANNRLTRLNQSTFKPLFSSISSLDLSKNPINCNCDLKWLVDWVNKRLHLINIDKTICSSASLAHLREKNLLDFDADKLCRTNIGIISIIPLAVVCFSVVTILVCRNKWQLKYKIFLLRLAVLGYKEKQDAREHDDYEYDMNVIFYDGDEEWIQDHLRPALEEHLPQFQKNLFGDEDLVPGMHYLDSVDYVVTHSYKTVIVLSRAAVRDHWFILKFRTAMDHVSDTQTEFVLVVFLEDIPDDELPFLVRLYLSDGRPYIHWTEDVRGQGYFWNELSKNLTVNLRMNDMIPNE
nr:slit homolog 2 protein-like [Lytechinus pictus]